MGQISKKLARRFTKWSGRFRQEARTVPIPKDVRLCPPILDLVEYHVTITTPYILTQASKSDWTAYLNRAMLQLKGGDEDHRLHELLKYGLSLHHWNEFIFQAYHHHQYDAIFLAGLPDVKGSLPHA